ncbi:hypothetical protein BP00DRAFT_426376 [Aspergillus indologenus CBS 114.80]|uniref:Uncharacterized protein n=1 Tax=Aspergillus indologenus CBS 114.80 TaxID=1450541 RepID=A0A2V5I3K2_9EURO|nr:hypothetical protein BP00DRAFT_426376 [Aspergillus indologenus CBS 114.80]
MKLLCIRLETLRDCAVKHENVPSSLFARSMLVILSVVGCISMSAALDLIHPYLTSPDDSLDLLITSAGQFLVHLFLNYPSWSLPSRRNV